MDLLPNVKTKIERIIDRLTGQLRVVNSTSSRFPETYIRTCLTSKRVGTDSSVPLATREDTAWDKFLASERLIEAHYHTYPKISRAPKDARTSAILLRAQCIIADILGEFDSDEFVRSAEYSGGSSTQRNRTESSTKNKYADYSHCTPDAARVFKAISQMMRLPPPGDLVPGSYGFCVPKNDTTERLCFKEPQGNMFLQKGLGKMIRSRLRRVGINLNDQRINGLGCNNLDKATVDFSDASNRISFHVVCDLLAGASPVWLDMLCATRSHFVRLRDGTWHRLWMFSGMGNGFTFELESLLFYAVTRAVAIERGTSQHVLVYGDDVVCCRQTYYYARSVYAHLGWRVNTDKSHACGQFRESCGYHYYRGQLITPTYIKDQSFQKLGDVFWLRNSLQATYETWPCRSLGIAVSRIDQVLRRLGLFLPVPPSHGLRTGIRLPLDLAAPMTGLALGRKRRTPLYRRDYIVRSLKPLKTWYKVSQQGAYLQSLRQCTGSIVSPFLIVNGKLYGNILLCEPPSPNDVPQGHVEWSSGTERLQWSHVAFEDWL